MKSETIKGLLGNELQFCTNDNFKAGYDPIGEIIDNYESLIFDDEIFLKDAYEAQQDIADKWLFLAFSIINMLPHFTNEQTILNFEKLLIEDFEIFNFKPHENSNVSHCQSNSVIYMSAALIYSLNKYRIYNHGGQGIQIQEIISDFLKTYFK